MLNSKLQEKFNERNEQFNRPLDNIDVLTLKKSDDQQNSQLMNILDDSIRSVTSWCSYILYMKEKFPEAAGLPQLILTCFAFINFSQDANNEKLANVVVLLASLQGNDEKSLKVFETCISEKKMCTKSSRVFVAWADIEDRVHGSAAAINVIRNGCTNGARPRQELVSVLMKHQQRKLDNENTTSNAIAGGKRKSKAVEAQSPKPVTKSPKKSKVTASPVVKQSATVTPTKSRSTKYTEAIPDPNTVTPRRSTRATKQMVLESSTKSSKRPSSEREELTVGLDDDGITDEVTRRVKPTRSSKANIAEPSSIDSRDDNRMVIEDDEDKTEGSCATNASTDSIGQATTAPLKKLAKSSKGSVMVHVKASGKAVEAPATSGPSSKSKTRRSVSFKQAPLPVVAPVVEDPSSSTSTTQSLSMGTFGQLLSDPARRIHMNGHCYLRLAVLGKGGSSCVYRVMTETGELYAYKRVEVKNVEECDEEDSVNGDSSVITVPEGSQHKESSIYDSYVNEITLLNKLKGCNHVIQLRDYEVNREEKYVAMVMEMGDIDLARVLQKQKSGKKDAKNGLGNDLKNPFFIRLVWQEMLEAVDYIHTHFRIVHGDLKPANFVFVRGHLKLIDFGIAKSISNNTTNIYRDSQIGTLNYMAPEAITATSDVPKESADGTHRSKTNASTNSSKSSKDSGKDETVIRLGRSSDVWSLGCILYQLIYGRPPFAEYTRLEQKLFAILNPSHDISYPLSADGDHAAIHSIKGCLQRIPKDRVSISELYTHPYLKIGSVASSNTSSSGGVLCVDADCDSGDSDADTLPLPVAPTVLTSHSMPPAQEKSLNNISKDELRPLVLSLRKLGSQRSSGTDEVTEAMITQIFDFVKNRPSTDTTAGPSSSSSVASHPAAVSPNGKKSLSSTLTNRRVSGVNRGIVLDGDDTSFTGNTEDVTSIVVGGAKGNSKVTMPMSSAKRRSSGAGTGKLNNAVLATGLSAAKRSAVSQRRSSGRISAASLQLPLSLQQQIQNQRGALVPRTSTQDGVKCSKWQKPKGTTPEKQDMRSVLERRFGEIRKFLGNDDDEEEDNNDFDTTDQV